LLLTPKHFVSKFVQKTKLKIEVSTYFAIVIGRAILRKESVLLASLFIIVYLMNVPVCWRSKAQRGVTLSSSKAEYVAISEAVKEIKFIYYLLREIGIEVNLPITVKTDNVGAMFMAQNASSGVRTRHIDTRYHYVRENLEEGIINIEFVKSIENDSDIFTKNVTKFLEVHAEEYKH
jgi:hypothetical protein